MVKTKDKYSIERRYISNRKARSRQKLKGVRYFVAHETANPTANADNHYTYFNNINFSASAHTFIDSRKILEIIPLDEKAWHVQYGNDRRTLGLGYANDYAIGTELCRTGDFEKSYDRYVWYHAYLCKRYGKQPKKHITAHKFEDPLRRNDPHSFLEPNGVTWNQFINDVQSMYDNWNGEVSNNQVVERSGFVAGAKHIKKENAYFLPKHNIKVRNIPSVYGTHTGTLPKGSSINYHNVYRSYELPNNEGYMWLQYVGYSGNALYVPYRRSGTRYVNKQWGTFHSTRP